MSKFGKTGRYRVTQPVQRALYELEEERRYSNPYYTRSNGGDMYITSWDRVGVFLMRTEAEWTAAELAQENNTYPKVVSTFPK